VGGRGKCPGAPSHHLRRQKGNWNGKNGRPKGTVKSRMAKKREWQLKKKKNIRSMSITKQKNTNIFHLFHCQQTQSLLITL
jgi:hypothetical protein